MNYVAVLADGQRAVELNEQGPGQFDVCIDGRTYRIDALVDPDGHRQSLLLGSHSFAVQLWQQGATCRAALGGIERHIEVLNLRQAHLRQARHTAHNEAGTHVIVAPMPGKVVATLAAVGDKVEAGQGLVVIEAMKMENELRAPCGGIIKDVAAAVGTAVEGGTPLCTIG